MKLPRRKFFQIISVAVVGVVLAPLSAVGKLAGPAKVLLTPPALAVGDQYILEGGRLTKQQSDKFIDYACDSDILFRYADMCIVEYDGRRWTVVENDISNWFPRSRS